MKCSEEIFDEANYYDSLYKLYLDVLPDGYYEKDGKIYQTGGSKDPQAIARLEPPITEEKG